MKRFLLIALAAAMVLALLGCNVTTTTTTTKTETHTDANGNTTTKTVTTTDRNGEVTTSETVETSVADPGKIVATIAFCNETGISIHAINFSSAADENWGDNILGDEPLEDGDKATFDKRFTYHDDNLLWDIRVADYEGNKVECRDLNMANAADPEDIVIVLTYDETDGLSAEVQ